MVETMASESRFQSQLASIMEMLAKTAVLEIGKLVEESQAVLRREISRTISENHSLKTRCSLLESELRASRRSVALQQQQQQQRAGAPQSAAKALTATGPRPTIDGVFGKEWCMDLWKERDQSVTQRNQNPCMIESIDLIDDGPEMIIIKDEMFEDGAEKNRMRKEARGPEKGPVAPSAESSEDLLSYTVPVDNMAPRPAGEQPFDAQPFDARPPPLEDAAATASNASTEDLSGFFPSGVPPNSQKSLGAALEQKKFECVFCGKNFNYLSYLKVHLRTHSGEKPFGCVVCGKRFAQKTYLKIHMRTHSGERPYTCLECAKSFSQKSSLNIHLRSHTGEKPYSCVDCGKRYAYKHGFNIHQCNG